MKALNRIGVACLLASALAAPVGAQARPAATPTPFEARSTRPAPIAILLDGKPFPGIREATFRPAPARRTLFAAAVGESGDGSEQHPWTDLQEALCALSPGDRLRVRAGTYSGEFRVDSSCRDGTRALPIQVVFDGKARLVPGGGAPVLTIRKAHWQLVGLYLDLGESRADGAALEGPEAHDIVLAQARIAGGAGPGIRIGNGTAHVTVAGSRISKTRAVRPGLSSVGIEIEAGARDVLLEDNRLHQNPAGSIRVSAPAAGGRPAKNVRVIANTIHDDGSTAISAGGVDGLWVVGNTISDVSGTDETRGITLEDVRRGVVRSNHLAHCAVAIRAGRVDPEGGATLAVKGISIDRNYLETGFPGGTAIDIEAGDSIRVANNVIDGYADGILILGKSVQVHALSVTNNLVLGVSGIAFALPDPASAMLFDYNVFSPRGDRATVELGGDTVSLTRFLAGGSMSHSKVLMGVEIRNRDLARVSGIRTVDAGKRLDGITFKGSAPDLGVAER